MTVDERLVRDLKRGDVRGVREMLSLEANPDATDSKGAHGAPVCLRRERASGTHRGQRSARSRRRSHPGTGRRGPALTPGGKGGQPRRHPNASGSGTFDAQPQRRHGDKPPELGLGCAGSSRAVSSLLAAGANDRRMAQTGCTNPLAMAVGGFATIGGLLAVPGAMKMAVECGHSKIFMMLLATQGEEKQGYWARCSPQGLPMLFWCAGRSSLIATHLLLAAGADETSGINGQYPSNAIGSCLPEGARIPATVADVGRMQQRGPAFRALSWAWPTLKAAGSCVGGRTSGTLSAADPNPDATTLSVQNFRSRKRFFVSGFVRYANN